jgi:uncharacterized protein with PQ loop repeat
VQVYYIVFVMVDITQLIETDMPVVLLDPGLSGMFSLFIIYYLIPTVDAVYVQWF